MKYALKIKYYLFEHQAIKYHRINSLLKTEVIEKYMLKNSALKLRSSKEPNINELDRTKFNIKEWNITEIINTDLNIRLLSVNELSTEEFVITSASTQELNTTYLRC